MAAPRSDDEQRTLERATGGPVWHAASIDRQGVGPLFGELREIPQLCLVDED